MESLFRPNTYLYEGHTSEELREALQKYEIPELLKIYKVVSGWQLSKKIKQNKELLIEEIIYKTLSVCNHGWVFRAEKGETAPCK